MASIKKMVKASTMPVAHLVRNLAKATQPKEKPAAPPAVGRNIFGTFDASKPHRRIRKG